MRAPYDSARGGSAISFRDLRMAYDGREVVRGIDLEVAEGHVFAFDGDSYRMRGHRTRLKALRAGLAVPEVSD